MSSQLVKTGSWICNVGEVGERRVKGEYLLHLRELPFLVLRSVLVMDEDNVHLLTQSGQLLLVRNHFDIQSRWNTCPQLPQAMLRPSSEAAVGLAWNSMLASCKLFLHIAHVSVHIDHDHTATALHCGSSWDGGSTYTKALTFLTSKHGSLLELCIATWKFSKYTCTGGRVYY
jgi:hypothetical protein